MPWLQTVNSGSSAGSNGAVFALPPVLGAIAIPLDLQKPMPMPSGVSVIKEQTCAHTYMGSQYQVGGYSQNLVTNRKLRTSVQGLRAIANQLVAGAGSGTKIGVTAVAGPGLTASVTVAVVPYDPDMGEIGPLSMVSPSVSIANQNIKVDNLPLYLPQEINFIAGTTPANATVNIVAAADFLNNAQIGDEMALSSAPTTYSKIIDIPDSTHATLATALGNGTTQGIIIKRNSRATMWRVYIDIDGTGFRVAAQRQIGATSITCHIATLADLGELFTEDFTQFERGKFSVIFNDRQVIAGFASDPTRIDFSLIGLPERRSSISLKTLNGKAVSAMYIVNETLIVTAGFRSYRIVGYTEDDIAMKEAKSDLGCICNAGVQIIHGYAFVPTHLGMYLVDGETWFPLNRWSKKPWVKDYRARPLAYEQGWSVQSPIGHTYSYYVGRHPLTPGLNALYVLDYETCLPTEGGDMGQPRLIFDTSSREYECGAILSAPGSERGDAFMGACDGKMYQCDQDGNEDDDADANEKSGLVLTGADDFGDVGGDSDHSKEFTNFELYAVFEETQVTIELYAGDEYAYVVPGGVGSRDGGSTPVSQDPVYTWAKTVGISERTTGGGNNYSEPRTIWSWQYLPGVTGKRMTLALRFRSPADSVRYFGHCFDWKEGASERRNAFTIHGG